MKLYWYVDAQGNHQGPYSRDDLRKLKEDGVIGDSTQILDDSTQRTTRLSELLSNTHESAVLPATTEQDITPAPPTPPVIPPVKKKSSRVIGVVSAGGGVAVIIVTFLFVVIGLSGIVGSNGGGSSADDDVLRDVYPRIHTGLTIGQARDLSKKFAAMKWTEPGKAMGITEYRWRGKTLELRLMTDYHDLIVIRVLEPKDERSGQSKQDATQAPAADKPVEKKAVPIEEKLLTRVEIEAKLGASVVTSREISEVMQELNGVSLDEFASLLNVEGFPKGKAEFQSLAEAVQLDGNKATGIEEAYQAIVPEGGLDVVAVDAGGPGDKIGLKPGMVINSWWVDGGGNLPRRHKESGMGWVDGGGMEGTLFSLCDPTVLTCSRYSTGYHNWRPKRLVIHADSGTLVSAIDEEAEAILAVQHRAYDVFMPTSSEVEPLLGIRLRQKYKRKTNLTKVGFEEARRYQRFPTVDSYFNDWFLIGGAPEERHDPSEAGSNPTTHPKGLNKVLQYAIPGIDAAQVEAELAQVVTKDRRNWFWPLRTYWQLRNRKQLKDVSFSMLAQETGQTWVFYSGEQAVLVMELRDLKCKDSDLMRVLNAHPEVAEKWPIDQDRINKKFDGVRRFPFQGTTRFLVKGAQSYLFGEDADGKFKVINVTDVGQDKLYLGMGTETCSDFANKYVWLNGGPPEKGLVGSSIAKYFAGTALETPLTVAEGDEKTSGVLGAQEVGYAFPILSPAVECVGSNYVARLYRHTESSFDSVVYYDYLFGKTSLIMELLKEGAARDRAEQVEQYKMEQRRQQELLQMYWDLKNSGR